MFPPSQLYHSLLTCLFFFAICASSFPASPPPAFHFVTSPFLFIHLAFPHYFSSYLLPPIIPSPSLFLAFFTFLFSLPSFLASFLTIHLFVTVLPFVFIHTPIPVSFLIPSSLIFLLKKSQPVIRMMYPSNSDIPIPIQLGEKKLKFLNEEGRHCNWVRGRERSGEEG